MTRHWVTLPKATHKSCYPRRKKKLKISLNNQNYPRNQKTTGQHIPEQIQKTMHKKVKTEQARQKKQQTMKTHI